MLSTKNKQGHPGSGIDCPSGHANIYGLPVICYDESSREYAAILLVVRGGATIRHGFLVRRPVLVTVARFLNLIHPSVRCCDNA